jgi:hypothetical protein
MWCPLLDGFVPIAFPTFHSTLGDDLSYTWNLWQSEWATDFMFRNTEALSEVMSTIVRHAFIGAHPERLLRYFSRPVKKDGQLRRDFQGSLKTSIIDLGGGYRIRHWYDANSVKAYNEANILRLELTMNNPYQFRVYRRKQGQPESAEKQLLPLRKGVADIALRARVSQEVNDRFAEHIASMKSATPFHSVLQLVTERKRRRGRSVRGIEPTGKDRALLTAIADPRFAVAGFCNKDLRQLLADDPRHLGKTDKQRSAMTSRALRLLRDHGIIRRLPKARRYQLTANGRRLVTTLQAALAASAEELASIAA